MEEQQLNGMDRISDLPDSLIHQIMSYLDMREVVQSSILSNRWRYLWLSTPYLDFDLDYWLRKTRNNSSSGYTDYRDPFMDFVENVLVRRGMDNRRMLKFRLFTYDNDFDFNLPRVSFWINMCIQQNVQHLVLRFPLGSFHPEDDVDLSSFLPDNLFASNVRELEISFVPKPRVPLPNIPPGSIINNLNLHGVKLPEGDAHGELDLSFGVAQVLRFDLCDVSHLKILSVSAPLVQKLWLRLGIGRKEEKHMWWSDSTIVQQEKAFDVKVKIYTPLLKTLTLATFSSKYFFPVDYSIEDELLYLDSAHIHICTDDYIDEESSLSLMKILQSVHNVRDLDLSISTKQVLTDFPILLEGLPRQFENLKCINLRDRMKFPRLHAMTNFLLSFPYINTLVWERNWSDWNGVTNEAEESVANEMEAIKTNLLLQNMLGNLVTVEFHNIGGVEIEMEFLAFVLERALILQKMIVKVSRALSGKKLERFKETCLHFPRASPNASMLFLADR